MMATYGLALILTRVNRRTSAMSQCAATVNEYS